MHAILTSANFKRELRMVLEILYHLSKKMKYDN